MANRTFNSVNIDGVSYNAWTTTTDSGSTITNVYSNRPRGDGQNNAGVNNAPVGCGGFYGSEPLTKKQIGFIIGVLIAIPIYFVVMIALLIFLLGTI